MAYTYHGATGLIKRPGKTISTFPDKTQRMDINYACRASYVPQALAMFPIGSAITGEPGFYVAQLPQATIGDDGFAQIQVSAWNVSGNQTLPDATVSAESVRFSVGFQVAPSGILQQINGGPFKLVMETQRISVKSFFIPGTPDRTIPNSPLSYAINLYFPSRNVGYSQVKWRLISERTTAESNVAYATRESVYIAAPETIILNTPTYNEPWNIYRFEFNLGGNIVFTEGLAYE